jgi:hypothetical protein
VSFVEQEAESSPLRPILLVAGVVLAVVLARWRAIVLMLFLLLASWIAFQVFLLARGTILYVNDGLTNLTEQYQQLPSVHVPPTGSATISPAQPITNCWRDRSLAGDCFKSGGFGRQSRPERLRTPEPPPPRHLRFRNCGPIGHEHAAWSAVELPTSRPRRPDLLQRQTDGRCWLNDRDF